MIRFSVFALWSLLSVVIVPAGTQDLDKANETAQRGDYVTALAELRPLAERGDPDAQYSLANLYRDGRGVPRDDDKAAAWYQRAAEGGSWSAAFDLGMLYWGQNLANVDGNSSRNDSLVRVHMWLGIAAATKNAGCVEVGAPLRDVVAQSMNAEQIASAQDLARAWLAKYWKTDVNVAAAKPGLLS